MKVENKNELKGKLEVLMKTYKQLVATIGEGKNQLNGLEEQRLETKGAIEMLDKMIVEDEKKKGTEEKTKDSKVKQDSKK